MLLITNGTVLTLDARDRVWEDGAVAVDGAKIAEVGERGALEQKYPRCEKLDACGGIIMPGMINTHTHAAMTLFRGMADDLPLQTWLQEHIWPAEAAHINAESVQIGTELAICEMVRAGVTTFCDMYFFEKEVAEAARRCGMRAVVGEGLLDFPTPNCKNPRDGLRYARELLEKYRDDELITAAVMPHSVYTCSAELLREAKNLAAEFAVPYHTHIAETKTEVADCRAAHGRSPLQYLDELEAVDEWFLGAHGVHLDEEDRAILQKKGGAISHNPSSNLKLASGIAPVAELKKRGVAVALGTDGAASNNSLNIFREMQLTALVQKGINDDPTVLPAREAVKMATREGARALHLEEVTGSLEAGKKADVIVVQMNRAHTIPCFDPFSQLVYAAGREDVSDVLINGRVVMRDRELVNIDEEKILREAAALAAKF